MDQVFRSHRRGHQKGSFTGADRQRQGLIERANGGTLLLDEISEMRSEAQAKLLRVIEEHRVLPVGGIREIPIDVRFLAASNRMPKQAIHEERLRADLYYRLNALAIHLPPLRERLEDLPILVDHFIRQANHDHQRQVEGVDPECLRALKNYRWPGNIRELRNVFGSAVLLARSTRERAKAIGHPILKARYADLAWEMCTVIARTRRDVAMAHLAIDAYLASVPAGIRPVLYHRFEAALRALDLATLIRDPQKTEQARAALLQLHQGVMTTLNGPWWFAFDRLIDDKRAGASEEEQRLLIADLEKLVLHYGNTSENFDPHALQAAAQRLIRRYTRVRVSAIM